MTLVAAALRRPAAAAIAIGAVVLVLAVPAIGLKTGPPSQTQLAHDDPIRQDFELIERAIGPGYDAPFVIVASADRGTVTEPRRLAALSRWQHRIAAQPGVQAVIGPAQVSRAVAPLRQAGALLAAGGETGPLAQLGRLGRNLGRAASGVAQLRDGISKASYGAGLLAQGSGTAEDGATLLATGLAQAGAGSERAVGALRTFAKGTRRLAGAQHRAALASLNVKFGLQSLPTNLRRNALIRSRRLQKALNDDAHETLPRLQGPAREADEQLRAALSRLEGMTVGKSDPDYAAALEAVRRASAAVSGTDPVSGAAYAPDYAGLPTELAALQARLVEDAGEAKQVTDWLVSGIILLKRLSSGATRLNDGLRKLEGAGKKLAHGSARLARAAGSLEGGLARLGAGATALAGGIARLRGGAEALEENLALGYGASYPLQSGLRRATVQVLSSSGSLRRRAGRLQRSTPGLFSSGYFVLSALDGARPRVRERAAEAIDLNGGGQAAAILVISRYTFNSPGSIALDKRLEAEAGALGREAGLQTGVAGGAAQLNDYSDVTRARIPFVVAAITLATFLVLLVILRALPLAAIAVGLNGGPAPGHGRGRLRHPHAALRPARGLAAGGTQLRRRGRRDGDLRRRLRALDRLRGLPPGADAGALRSRAGQRRRDRVRAGADRAGDNRRGGDHDGGLRRLCGRPDRHRQPARGRAHGGGAAGCHRGPHRPAAGADAAARRPGLVAAPIPRPGTAPAERLTRAERAWPWRARRTRTPRHRLCAGHRRSGRPWAPPPARHRLHGP